MLGFFRVSPGSNFGVRIYIFQNSVIFGGTKIWNKRYFQRVGQLDIQKIRPGLTLKSSNIIVIVLLPMYYFQILN